MCIRDRVHSCPAQSFECPGILHEDGLGAGVFNGPDQLPGRVAGVHRGGNGTVGDDAQIGQVEFGARLRVDGDDVAFAQSQRITARCNAVVPLETNRACAPSIFFENAFSN